MKVKFLLILCFVLSAQAALSQDGKITGKITDGKDGMELIGVAVMIKGTTTGTTTDIDGRYTLDKLAPGKHILVYSYVSYQSKETEISLKGGEITTVNMVMEESISTLSDVVIRVDRDMGNVASLLLAQKEATAIGNSIGADQISKSPVKNTGDILKKVSGASIQDNKFAVIRGLSDRYNMALINGAPLPSSEADRKAFSFDIFPSALLENMVITKTATPDMPSEFAGGLIQINTRDIPDRNFYSLSIGASYHSLTTGKAFKSYEGGKTDWLGIDDGSRSLPASLPNSEEYIKTSKREKLDYSRDFNGNWNITEKEALPNGSLQFLMGHKLKTKKANRELGSIFALTYNNSRTFRNVEIKDFEQESKIINSYTDEQYNQNILGGALWNLGLKLNQRNKISLKNAYNINSSDQTIVRQGTDVQAATERLIYGLYYQENKLLTSQLTGDHFIEAKKIKVNWTLGYSNIYRKIPDFRRIRYNRPMESSDSIPYTAFFSTNASPEDGGRFYSNLDEQSYSGSYDVLIPLNKKEKPTLKADLKIGGFHQQRARYFGVRVLGYTKFKSSQFDNDIAKLPIDQIFAVEHVDTNGFVMQESTNKSDQYTAQSTLHAGYFMFDMRYKQRTRIVWGARIEHFNQILNSEVNGKPLEINTKKLDVLPSINLTYELKSKSNLRFAFSQTLSRPEFRELAPFSFFDFNRFIEIVGYDSLQRTKINNFDLRYEIYPNPGQVFSLGVFYKDFSNPIEQVLGSDIGGGTKSTTYRNALGATNYGAELEFRRDLAFIRNTAFWNSFTFSANLAYIVSSVDVSNIAGAEARPLQGQSPYIINTGLTYTDTARNFSLTVNYNRIGKRISFVGVDIYPDFYEKGRDIVDIQLSKSFGKRLDVKLTVSDLFAQELLVYQNPVGNENKNYEVGIDNVMRRYTYGTSVGFGVSYKF